MLRYTNKLGGTLTEPMKFRKKPVEIEAMLLTEHSHGDIVRWARSYTPLGHVLPAVPSVEHPRQLLIHTLEGTMRADVGDWIIRGVQGEFYPCRGDIFEATYEAV